MGQAKNKRNIQKAAVGQAVPICAEWLAQEEAYLPGFFREMELAHIRRKAERPSWSYVDATDTGAALTRAARSPAQIMALLQGLKPEGFAMRAVFLAGWRASRVVHRFDARLAAELAAAPSLSGPLPAELFKRMPYFSVFIETPLADRDGNILEGFGASLEYHAPDQPPYLDLLFPHRTAAGDIRVLFVGLRLEGEPLDVVIQRNCRESGLPAYGAANIEALCRKALPLLLWLCQEDPDAVKRLGPPPPLASASKAGHPLPVGNPVEVWTVGVRVGALFAKAKADADAAKQDYAGGTHARPKPHVRAGHWHLYWCGEGGRTPRVRYLAPCLVNAASPANLPVVLRKAA